MPYSLPRPLVPPSRLLFPTVVLTIFGAIAACGDTLVETPNTTPSNEAGASDANDGGLSAETSGSDDSGGIDIPDGSSIDDSGVVNLPDSGDAGRCALDPSKKIAFVTSGLINGYSGIVAEGAVTAYDNFCNAAALAAGISSGRLFKAYMREPGGSAPWTRVSAGSAAGWFRRDGQPLFNANANLEIDAPLVPLEIDEKCELVSSPQLLVWTGVGPGATSTCGFWDDGDVFGGVGDPKVKTVYWQNNGETICADPRHLYCFQVN